MSSQLLAMKNAFQSIICREYSGLACLHVGIFFLIGLIPKPWFFFRNSFLNILIHSGILKINRLACNYLPALPVHCHKDMCCKNLDCVFKVY